MSYTEAPFVATRRVLSGIAVRLARRTAVAPSGCWEWQGARNGRGYGVIGVGASGTMLAHRASWLTSHARAPALHVLHRCDNPPCINPDHLFLGTDADNMRDKCQKGRDHNGSKTHCKWGHELTPDNVYAQTLGGRNCKPCAKRRARESEKRRSANV